MKRRIELLELRRAEGQRRFRLVEALRESPAQGDRVSGDGHPERARLENFAKLADFAEFAHVVLEDEGPPLGTNFQQSLDFESLKGLPDRGATDTQLFGENDLGQLLA